MEIKNYEYLSKQLLYSGFGEALNDQLKSQMEKGNDEFTLNHKRQYGNDLSDSKLQFTRSEQGYYFFNKFELTVHKADDPAKILSQTFYNGRDNSYTLKEGFNLLSGRSVHKTKLNKDAQTYETWDKLNLTEKNKYGNYPIVAFGEKYGFNLERELGKHPIKELKSGEDRQLLMDSLKKGNRQLVKMEEEKTVADGENKGQKELQTVERYIEANPKMRRIDFFDKEGNPVKKQEASQKKETSQNQDAPKSNETVKREPKRTSRSRSQTA